MAEAVAVASLAALCQQTLPLPLAEHNVPKASAALAKPAAAAAAAAAPARPAAAPARRKRKQSAPKRRAPPAAEDAPSGGKRAKTTKGICWNAQLEEVVGQALVWNRQTDPPMLFSCDMCGRQIYAGLRGVELYASCTECDDFDVCLHCVSNGDAAATRREAPRLAAHPHPLQLVDRAADDERDLAEIDARELREEAQAMLARSRAAKAAAEAEAAKTKAAPAPRSPVVEGEEQDTARESPADGAGSL